MAIKFRDAYRYFVWVIRGDGEEEIAAWYDDLTQAKKEVAFLKGKGYTVWWEDNPAAA